MAHPELPETAAGAAGHREAQFEACDMVAGRLAPELGGSEAHLDGSIQDCGVLMRSR